MKKEKFGLFVFSSVTLVQAGQMIFSGFMMYDLFLSISAGVITYIFYKIFANSIIFIREYGVKKAFSIEEIVGASLIVAIAISAFGDFAIFGLEVKSVLSILLVLILGWKNGVLIGASAGITIGTVLGIIGTGEPIMVASYALSGMISGILSRFGKIGVIVGFAAGNAILTFTSNGNTLPVIYFKEILVASIGLLLVPKSIKINVEDLFDKHMYLPTGSVGRIEDNKETVYKLNNVSEVIHEMSRTYVEAAATVVEDTRYRYKE